MWRQLHGVFVRMITQIVQLLLKPNVTKSVELRHVMTRTPIRSKEKKKSTWNEMVKGGVSWIRRSLNTMCFRCVSKESHIKACSAHGAGHSATLPLPLSPTSSTPGVSLSVFSLLASHLFLSLRLHFSSLFFLL